MSHLGPNRVRALGLAALALIVAFILFRDDLPSIDLEQLVQDLSEGLGDWTYVLVAVLAFLETGAFVGLVAPGEFTVMLGGAVAGQGVISLPLILAITWVAAWAGDSVSFLLGAKLGRGFVLRHGHRFGITEERLRQVEAYLARHGGKTILVGRFIGLVRALAPFLAGSGGMRYRAFVPYSILGTGLWAATFILIGYFASQSLDKVSQVVGRGLIAFGFFVGAIVAVIVAYRLLRRHENRERVVSAMERRPLLRPLLALGRRLRPQARFVWQRLTPGGLGLELTTLLAVLAVALYVLIAYWSVISGNPDPTAGDRTALDLADEIRTPWLNAVAEAITTLGSAWVVFPLAGLAACALAATRRWLELAVLVIGLILAAVLAHEIKEWTERPRPEGAMVDADGYSFPSGHAVYATTYTWLAVTLAVRLVPGLTWRGLVVGAGIALTTLIGLTRVYLRVHWLSDVNAGWALGISAFAAIAAMAVVVGHFRDNPPDGDRAAHSPGDRGAAGDRA